MKRTITLLLAVLALQLTIVSALEAQTKSDQIAELLNLYEELDKFNGSALVSVNGNVIYKGGNGWANMEWKIPNESDTKHRLGSITKQFTAMLILQLMEDDKLKLDVPVTTYLPDYPKDNGDKITIHHLLTHTSGLPNYTSFPSFFNGDSRNPYTHEEFVGYFADSTLNFAPGKSFEYSNSGYFLLGYIIEKVTGNTYEKELKTRIFDPLSMDDTGYDHHADILEKRAAGYERQNLSYINAPYLDMGLPYAAGSLYSTVEDLYKWDQALYEDKLISESSKQMMFDKHVEAFGGHYAYGWSISANSAGQKVISHGGGINGFNTLISRYPETKDAIILFNNTGGADLQKIANSINAINKGESYENPKKSAARELYSVLTEGGVEKAKTFFAEIKNNSEYDVSEREINGMGYDFLLKGKTKEALTIFKINTEQFPDSWNVFDSYGEALMENGDKELAIANYTKSVEMNPGNAGGISMLKKLGVDASTLVKDFVVEESILASYVGEYELQPGFIITITKEGNQLHGQATGQGKNPIFPKSETEFYLKVVAAEVVFNKDKQGAVDSLTLKQGGREMPGKKIK